MKRWLIAMLAVLQISSAYAEDGLVVHFTVTKTAGTTTQTYTDGVLMRLTEGTTMTFPGQYEMRLQSRSLGKDDINLVVTLKDLSTGKPVYAGSAGTTLKVGTSAKLDFHPLQNSQAGYEVFVDTSYGKLPQSVQ